VSKAIIFDFDYTLADSSAGCIECINFALESLGLPGVPTEVAVRTIGLSLPETFRKLVSPRSMDRSDEFTQLFITHADRVMASATILFDEVPEVVEVLQDRGFSLGIVSTKFRYRIETILSREGLLDAFDVIVGGEDVTRHKPDPAGLLWAIEQLGSWPTGARYVGDSVIDAETAQRAGMPFVAVLSGVTPLESFKVFPVLDVLGDLSGLPDLLEDGDA
jgi:phosphoglycolate phosphatase